MTDKNVTKAVEALIAAVQKVEGVEYVDDYKAPSRSHFITAWHAAKSLGQSGSKEALPVLSLAVKSKSSELARCAAEALGLILRSIPKEKAKES